MRPQSRGDGLSCVSVLMELQRSDPLAARAANHNIEHCRFNWLF